MRQRARSATSAQAGPAPGLDDLTTVEAEAVAAELARYYDLDLSLEPGDLDLYLALAARADGAVLELAAGTGRLAVPLAAAGHAVTALDLDPAMLARARDRWRRGRPREPGAAFRAVRSDLRTARLGARFRLAILALNSLFLLPDAGAQAAAFESLARHLVPGGLAAVDVWLPHPEELTAYDGRLVLEWERPDPERGERVAKIASARHDPATGSVELTTWFDAWPAAGGAVRRTHRLDRLRLLGAAELVRLAEAAGLEVETLAGDYALTAFGPGADRAVLIARAPQGRRGRGSGGRPLV